MRRSWTSTTSRRGIRTGSSGVRRPTSTRAARPSAPSTSRGRSVDSVAIKSIDEAEVRRERDAYAADVFRRRSDVEEIIVCGSFANGNWAPGSDVDLFIVLTAAVKPPRDRIPDFLPGKFPTGVDIFPYTRDEMAALGPSSLLDAVRASRWRYRR